MVWVHPWGWLGDATPLDARTTTAISLVENAMVLAGGYASLLDSNGGGARGTGWGGDGSNNLVGVDGGGLATVPPGDTTPGKWGKAEWI